MDPAPGSAAADWLDEGAKFSTGTGDGPLRVSDNPLVVQIPEFRRTPRRFYYLALFGPG